MNPTQDPAFQSSIYISVTETAKLIRTQLKKNFPGTKFSVRSSSFSGGSAIDITWTDGPATDAVDSIVDLYKSRDFDGSIDMASSIDHWLHQDGSVTIAHRQGTTGSKGCIQSEMGDPEPGNGAKLVHFGSNYVSTHHEFSSARVEEAVAAYETYTGRKLNRERNQDEAGHLCVHLYGRYASSEDRENNYNRLTFQLENYRLLIDDPTQPVIPAIVAQIDEDTTFARFLS